MDANERNILELMEKTKESKLTEGSLDARLNDIANIQQVRVVRSKAGFPSRFVLSPLSLGA